MTIENAPIILPKGYSYYVGNYRTKFLWEALRENKRTYLSLIVASDSFDELEILIV